MLNSLLLRYLTLDTYLLYEFREIMTKFFFQTYLLNLVLMIFCCQCYQICLSIYGCNTAFKCVFILPFC